jgi:hypothetical protein
MAWVPSGPVTAERGVLCKALCLEDGGHGRGQNILYGSINKLTSETRKAFTTETVNKVSTFAMETDTLGTVIKVNVTVWSTVSHLAVAGVFVSRVDTGTAIETRVRLALVYFNITVFT